MREYDIIVIFSGFNQRAVVSFLRTLQDRKISNYVIVARSEDDSIYQTEYQRHIIWKREKLKLDREELIKILKYIKIKMSVTSGIIVPSTEFLNRYLLSERAVLNSEGFEVPLVSSDLYNLISDKESFHRVCRASHLLTPDCIDFPANYEIPFVAKPKKYIGDISKKIVSPVIIDGNERYERFCNELCKEDFYFERYLKGYSYYLLYYIKRNGDIYKYSQENFVQQPNGKSILYAKPSIIHMEEISKKYENLLKKLSFRGFIMIELRYCEGEFYMIEANPRFWGPSQLFCDCNANFFEVFLNDFGFIDKFNFSPESKDVKYCWFGGYIQTLISKQNPIFYHINEREFAEVFKEWLKYDIYNREDTRQLFISHE